MKIEVEKLQTKPALSIRTHSSVENLPKTIGDSYHQIAAYMQGIGEQP